MGFAEEIDFRIMTTELIKEKLQKVLEDPKYTENAKKLSVRFRDQKEKPLDRAIWWIEFLLRNPNADHMKSPVLRLGFFSGNSFDIIVFITLGTLSFLLFAIILLAFYTSRYFQNDYAKSERHKIE